MRRRDIEALDMLRAECDRRLKSPCFRNRKPGPEWVTYHAIGPTLAGVHILNHIVRLGYADRQPNTQGGSCRSIFRINDAGRAWLAQQGTT